MAYHGRCPQLLGSQFLKISDGFETSQRLGSQCLKISDGFEMTETESERQQRSRTVTLYDVLRFLGLARRRIIEKTLADIERDEAAARQRVLDAATRMRDTREEN